MKIEIEPTERFESVNGSRCRIWTGKTDKGVNVECFVAMVQVHKDEDQTEFQRELSEVKMVRELAHFDHRLVLE